MPVQRIPRSIMLLSQLQKYTLQQTKDHQLLKLCSERISSILEDINKAINQEPGFQMGKVVDLINDIGDLSEDDLPTNLKRSFVHEGSVAVIKIANPDKKSYITKKIRFILFSDYLVICSKVKKVDNQDGPAFKFLESGSVGNIQDVTLTKKKEFSMQWKTDEVVCETKTEEDTKSWVSFLSSANAKRGPGNKSLTNN